MPRITIPSLFFALILWMGGRVVQAQDEAVLYAGLIKTRGYVVGSALAASGLHRFEGDTTWTPLGWNNPRVIGIAHDPANTKTLFLACGNGVLRTLDGGASWRLVTDWRINEGLDIAVDPNAPTQVYLATAFGVWRSADGGDTWEAANTGLDALFARTIEIDRGQTGRLLGGTEEGLYLSDDGARTWHRVGAEGVLVLDLHQSPTDPAQWIAATEGRGIVQSEDGGQTWHYASGDLVDKTIHAVAIDPFNAKRRAAVGWDTGVYLSTDQGLTWTQHTQGLPTRHFYEVLFDANVPGRIWAATVEEGLYVSDDNGHTWHEAGLYGTLIFDMRFIQPETP